MVSRSTIAIGLIVVVVCGIGLWEFWLKDELVEEDTVTVGPVGNQVDIPIDNLSVDDVTVTLRHEFANPAEYKSAFLSGEVSEGDTVQINLAIYKAIQSFSGRTYVICYTDEPEDPTEIYLHVYPASGAAISTVFVGEMPQQGDLCAVVGIAQYASTRVVGKLYNATIVKLS